MDDVALHRRSLFRFAAVVVGLVLVGAAGYLGFVALAESDREVGAGVMVLAAATGFAAFFSPCSFPLLLTFLARQSEDSRGTALLSALRVGAGAAALLGLLAVVLAGGGSALGNVIGFDTPAGRVFRLTVGLVLVLFGLRQARLLRLHMRWLDGVAASAARRFDPSGVSRLARRDVVYGFGYLLAGFG